MKKLTALHLSAAKPGDAPMTDETVTGLVFQCSRPGAGKFALRYVSPVTGRRRMAGLGAWPDVSLAKARKRGQAMRDQIADGIDPLDVRKQERAAVERESKVPTFGAYATSYHADVKANELKKTKNVAAWLRSLETHFKPLWDRRIDSVIPADIRDTLKPIWRTTPRIAADVLQRADEVFSVACGEGYVTGSPCGPARRLLGRQNHRTRHQPALPWAHAAGFVRDHLRGIEGIEPHDSIRGALALQVMTACRPAEARNAEWAEFDFDGALWSIPEGRMKAKWPHVIPLPSAAVALLRRIQAAQLHPVYVFPNTTGRNTIADARVSQWLRGLGLPSDIEGRTATPHGFRSTFSDFSIDHGISEKVFDRALSHREKGQTRPAYMRSMMVEPRRDLMEVWSHYLMTGERPAVRPSNVIPLNEHAA